MHVRTSRLHERRGVEAVCVHQGLPEGNKGRAGAAADEKETPEKEGKRPNGGEEEKKGRRSREERENRGKF